METVQKIYQNPQMQKQEKLRMMKVKKSMSGQNFHISGSQALNRITLHNNLGRNPLESSALIRGLEKIYGADGVLKYPNTTKKPRKLKVIRTQPVTSVLTPTKGRETQLVQSQLQQHHRHSQLFKTQKFDKFKVNMLGLTQPRSQIRMEKTFDGGNQLTKSASTIQMSEPRPRHGLEEDVSELYTRMKHDSIKKILSPHKKEEKISVTKAAERATSQAKQILAQSSMDNKQSPVREDASAQKQLTSPVRNVRKIGVDAKNKLVSLPIAEKQPKYNKDETFTTHAYHQTKLVNEASPQLAKTHRLHCEKNQIYRRTEMAHHAELSYTQADTYMLRTARQVENTDQNLTSMFGKSAKESYRDLNLTQKAQFSRAEHSSNFKLNPADPKLEDSSVYLSKMNDPGNVKYSDLNCRKDMVDLSKSNFSLGYMHSKKNSIQVDSKKVLNDWLDVNSKAHTTLGQGPLQHSEQRVRSSIEQRLDNRVNSQRPNTTIQVNTSAQRHNKVRALSPPENLLNPWNSSTLSIDSAQMLRTRANDELRSKTNYKVSQQSPSKPEQTSQILKKKELDERLKQKLGQKKAAPPLFSMTAAEMDHAASELSRSQERFRLHSERKVFSYGRNSSSLGLVSFNNKTFKQNPELTTMAPNKIVPKLQAISQIPYRNQHTSSTHLQAQTGNTDSKRTIYTVPVKSSFRANKAIA